MESTRLVKSSIFKRDCMIHEGCCGFVLDIIIDLPWSARGRADRGILSLSLTPANHVGIKVKPCDDRGFYPSSRVQEWSVDKRQWMES